MHHVVTMSVTVRAVTDGYHGQEQPLSLAFLLALKVSLCWKDLFFVVFSTLRTALTLHARTPCSYVASAIRWQSKVAADGGHLTTLLLSALPNLDQSVYFPQDKFDPAGVHALKCMFKSAGCFITDNNGVGF
mgnify:CR=1 FL=1